MTSMWKTISYNEEQAVKLQSETGLSLLLSRLLVQREIYSRSEAEYYLYADLNQLSDPYQLQGMTEAIERINRAAADHEKIMIYGDYDVDGICSVVILYEALKALGADVDYYIPDRFSEGYGLNSAAIRELKEQGTHLMITVDCGISSLAEALLCKELGLDLIITDHHTPGINQPEAYAVINPKNDTLSETRDLAGVGVSLKMAMALSMKNSQVQVDHWLDLAALATVADMVPLRYENRILVRAGLKAIPQTKRPGLQALIKLTGLEGKKIDSWSLGFLLAPKLNSAGRLENASLSVKLLLTRDQVEGRELAELLCALNQQRKAIEDSILEQAVQEAAREQQDAHPLVLVISGENWNSGVIGIVASRVAKIYNLPTIVISWENGVGRGSGRSVGQFDLFAALNHGHDFLIKFGGHKLAAGLSIEKHNLLNFKKAVNEFGQAHEADILLSRDEYADIEVAADEIDPQILDELTLMEPFGQGNPVPRFILRGVEICQANKVGKNGEHLKFKTLPGGFDSIAFKQGSLLDHEFWNYANADIIFSLTNNTYRGKSSLQLDISSLCPTYSNENLPASALMTKVKYALSELQKQRPALFIYNDYRSLMKHQFLIKHYFVSENIYILHGHLRVSARQAVEATIFRGKTGIILATAAGWQHYLKNYEKPANLRYVLYFWPDADKDDDLAGNVYERDVLPQNSYISRLDTRINLEDKGLIYVNSQKTLDIWQNRAAHYNEVNQPDMNIRRLIRSRFLYSEIPKLFTDGTHVSGIDYSSQINSIILADPPLSYADLEGLHLGINGNINYSIAFGENQLHERQQILSRLYPDRNLIISVWSFLIRQEGKEIKKELSSLLAQLNVFLKQPIKALEFLSVLHILEDLGLCQFGKSGSIIAIKFVNQGKKVINLTDSPYYLEGLASKRAFQHFISNITKKII